MGPRVIVTGANSGIGLASALEISRRGFAVVGTVRSEEKAEHVAAAADSAGVDITTQLLDVNDPAACAHLIEHNRPWALVNNAGYGVLGAVEDVDDEEARLALETMTIAPMRLARLALPHMREQGGGRIINVSSVYGFATTALAGWYQAAKHALEAVSDALRIEVARDGIRVIIVEPGGVRTPIWAGNEQELAERAGSRYARAYERVIDITRGWDAIMEQPEQVARVVAGAVEARSPRTRYLAGGDAWVLAAYDRFTLASINDRINRLLLDL